MNDTVSLCSRAVWSMDMNLINFTFFFSACTGLSCHLLKISGRTHLVHCLSRKTPPPTRNTPPQVGFGVFTLRFPTSFFLRSSQYYFISNMSCVNQKFTCDFINCDLTLFCLDKYSGMGFDNLASKCYFLVLNK